ncbi:DUF4192 domain-containing protein [Mycobacterium sp. MUNTM1]
MGRLVAGVVAVLGFVPVESLVLVLMRGGAVTSVMRGDLADPGWAVHAEHVADLVLRSGSDGVIAVVVSEQGAMCSVRVAEFESLVGVVSAALRQRGSRVLDAVVVDRIEAGGCWRRLDDVLVSGVLDEDPASSVFAVAAVVEGRRMYGSREELVAFVDSDSERVAALAPLVSGAGGAGEPVEVSVRRVVAAARRMAAGTAPDDGELAAVGATLTDVRIRDALLGLAVGEDAAAAEALWALLARVLPDPFRVEALVLLAASAYARGDGPLAGVSLGAALSADPCHRLAGLLDVALTGGVRPEEVRVVIAKAAAAVTV